MAPNLCNTCQSFPWSSLDRARVFRFAWWKRDTLQVPNDEFPADGYATCISHKASNPNSCHDVKDVQTSAETFRYHTTLPSLRTASKEGCHICRLVMKGFSEYSMDAVGPSRQEDAVAWYEARGCRIRITHEPSGGLLKFEFVTESASRHMALRYYFVSCGSELYHGLGSSCGALTVATYSQPTRHGRSLSAKAELFSRVRSHLLRHQILDQQVRAAAHRVRQGRDTRAPDSGY